MVNGFKGMCGGPRGGGVVVVVILVFLYSIFIQRQMLISQSHDFENNSQIPSYRKFFHVKPSERYNLAKVFMLGRRGTNELQICR